MRARRSAVKDSHNRRLIFKNCASFTSPMSEIGNTKVKKVKEFNIAMPIYDLLEYSKTYP